MSRPKNSRIVFDPPKFKGFKPYGFYAIEKEPVKLLFEEYTAIRLCDYELMTQAEAAHAMKISRPTFTRLYEHARRKIAETFTEARPIEVEQGNAYFDSDWFHCRACNVFFTTPEKRFTASECPLCHSVKVESMNSEKSR
jgi:uncharacterized protein